MQARGHACAVNVCIELALATLDSHEPYLTVL